MKTKQTTTTEPGRSDDGWADRLAARCHVLVDRQSLETTDLVLDAGTALWALFDRATDAANKALARAGVPERIIVERSGAEGVYGLTGPDDTYREIRVTLTISVAHGLCCGGASIATSQTRLFGYLEPISSEERTLWRVGHSGPEFTPEVVHDLFLSVFGDDPAATQRLSPISGMDLFQIPWN
jgi:hypothetical protein